MEYFFCHSVFLKEINTAKIKLEDVERIKEFLAQVLGIEIEDVNTLYYKKEGSYFETKLKAEKEKEGFNYMIGVTIISNDSGKVVIEGKLVKKIGVGLSQYPSFIKSMFDEIFSASFYKDLMSIRKEELEEICKKLCDEIETYIGLEDYGGSI